MTCHDFAAKLQAHLLGEHTVRRNKNNTIKLWMKAATEFFCWVAGDRGRIKASKLDASSTTSFRRLVDPLCAQAYRRTLVGRPTNASSFTACFNEINKLALANADQQDDLWRCMRNDMLKADVARRAAQDKKRGQRERNRIKLKTADLHGDAAKSSLLSRNDRAGCCRYLLRLIRRLTPALTRICANLNSGAESFTDPLTTAERAHLAVSVQVNVTVTLYITL
jgi:hypothetical protein